MGSTEYKSQPKSRPLSEFEELVAENADLRRQLAEAQDEIERLNAILRHVGYKEGSGRGVCGHAEDLEALRADYDALREAAEKCLPGKHQLGLYDKGVWYGVWDERDENRKGREANAANARKIEDALRAALARGKASEGQPDEIKGST